MTIIMGADTAMEQHEIKLWTNGMPGKGASEAETVRPCDEPDSKHITNVSVPTLKLFPVDTAEPAPFVIVCPGGGYEMLAYIKEGTEVAEWLNSIGISACVLKYRVPDNRVGALNDARQAVVLAREYADAWNIDRENIGMMGFSAGGHLTAACAASDVRPAFTVLVYPAYLDRDGSADLVDNIQVDASTPPAFIVQTQDDIDYYRSTPAYANALDAAGIKVESHLFARGGHGYGLRDCGNPVQTLWPKLCEAWMREMEFIK